jgi:putative tryptophan/tyrosine transport system substrate-binding protein
METGLERGRARRFMTGLDPEGQVTIGFRWAEGNSDRLPKLVADLVHGKGDARGEVLRPNNSDCLTVRADPIEAGLVASFGRPGGNMTGITSMSMFGGKPREILFKMVPAAATR